MRTTRPSTIITKLLPTLTLHRTTPLIPLNPETTLRTLLEFGSLHKINKLLIILIKTITHPILCTSHVRMELASAFQTVVFTTGRAEIVVEGKVEFEGS